MNRCVLPTPKWRQQTLRCTQQQQRQRHDITLRAKSYGLYSVSLGGLCKFVGIQRQ
ncbi:hypothetical protein DPMN_148417 [Dreissena polymorpha]|uniref:Uncharacterized protein n=1 Tax=Dreissena polymorpha TaxID=45954 RepID=A0A9D4FBU8_DREPO|nr:hypothetical protein DPMN_148417 [Dreissena polymorpha]